MKKLSEYVLERKGDEIDDQWIQDEKPLMTKDGRQVIIVKTDLSNIPNLYIGKVKMGDQLFDYTWEDNGTCVKAVDKYGNPKKIDDADTLVKAI